MPPGCSSIIPRRSVVPVRAAARPDRRLLAVVYVLAAVDGLQALGVVRVVTHLAPLLRPAQRHALLTRLVSALTRFPRFCPAGPVVAFHLLCHGSLSFGSTLSLARTLPEARIGSQNGVHAKTVNAVVIRRPAREPPPIASGDYVPLYTTRQMRPPRSSEMYSDPSGPSVTPTGRCLAFAGNGPVGPAKPSAKGSDTPVGIPLAPNGTNTTWYPSLGRGARSNPPWNATNTPLRYRAGNWLPV